MRWVQGQASQRLKSLGANLKNVYDISFHCRREGHIVEKGVPLLRERMNSLGSERNTGAVRAGLAFLFSSKVIGKIVQSNAVTAIFRTPIFTVLCWCRWYLTRAGICLTLELSND